MTKQELEDLIFGLQYAETGEEYRKVVDEIWLYITYLESCSSS